MRILFLCGSLEPGRDGVGDYTRRLAGEIIRQGHETMIIALHDRYVNETVTNDRVNILEVNKLPDAFNKLHSMWGSDSRILCCTHDADGTSIPVIRIGSSLPWRTRERIMGDVAEQFAADWASLQFVPYSFNPKGLPFQLVWMLRRLKKKLAPKWHIMFHELWCGMGKQTSLRHRLIGLIQKVLILMIYNFLTPLILNTSSRSYKQLLETINIYAEQLQLFSNVPYFASPINKTFDTAIVNAKNELLLEEKMEIFIFSTFGSWQRNWPCIEIFNRLNFLLNKNQYGAVIIAIGLLEPPEWFSDIYQNFSSLRFLYLGYLDTKSIDSIINHSDAGILTTTIESLEKSGSALAYIEREKRLLTYYEGVPKTFPVDDFHLVNNLKSGLEVSQLRKKIDTNYTNRLKQVCNKFLIMLANKEKN